MIKSCNSKYVFFFVTLGWIFNSVVFAQAKNIDKSAPALKTEIGIISTDNINPTLSSKNSAYGAGIKVSGQMLTRGEGNLLMVNYQGSFERYELNDSETLLADEYDFVSYQGMLLGRFFIADAWYIDTELVHQREDEKFGFGLSNLRDNVLLFDQRTQNQASLNLLYGNDTSNRSISLKLSSSDVEYADINVYSTLFNYQQTSLDLNVAFRQSSLTRWLLSFEADEDNYDSDLRDDSQLFRLLLGVDWQPSGKSKLKALFGVYQRQKANGENSSGLSWSIDYQYQARQDVLLTLSSSRLSDVGQSEFASESVNSGLAANLSYAYSEQWQFGAFITFDRSEYEDLLVSQILDENIARLQAKLVLKQHSHVSFEVMARDVSSNDELVDYLQNEARLSWHHIF